MAEDVQADEITLEDFDADEKVADKAEPSPAKEAKADKAPAKEAEVDKPEAKDTEEEKSDDTPTPPDVPTKDTPDEAEKPEDVPEEKPTKADERKTQLNSEIRDLVSQRNALKTEVEKANAEVYQPAAENELVGQPKDPDDPNSPVYTALEARVEAMRQEREVEKYNERVADAQLTLSSESERVLRDFPMFNSDSEHYDKELAERAAGFLEKNLILDPNTNQIIGSNISPYELYETIAGTHSLSAAKGQIQGQVATEKQLANVDANSNVAPPTKPKDPLMDLWKSDE